ncbi:MAG TPA: hypothetical protein VMW16_03030 [Sedimentisphaerales bacterium]|nr:hypothetical protein [Sedimentisphaerales bacterium]
MSLKNLIGKKFYRLMVLSEEPKRKGMRYFKCRCDCGNVKITQGVCLNNGSCKSCGCLQKEKASKLGKLKKTHGFSGTRFYRIWKGMRNRCYNKNEPAYPKYGGRGIYITERWHEFENFKHDMYDSYLLNSKRVGEKNISIDRKDNDGNYCPENCRWVTVKIQNSNRRPKKLGRNAIRTIRQKYHRGNGQELAREYNVSPAVISEIVNYKRNYN